MRKSKRVPSTEGLHAERDGRRDDESSVDAAVRERAQAGDRRFTEQLERWKQKQLAATPTAESAGDPGST